MAYLPQQVLPQGIEPFGTGQNMAGQQAPVIIMVQAPAPVKQKIPYDQRFPKKFMLTLSYIQLAMGILGIITQVIGLSNRDPDAHYAGAGIWCGIFFGVSAMFGILASLKPSFSTIVTFMVFAIIAAVFCLPLLVISSIGTAHSAHCYYGECRGRELKHAMFAIQVIISLVQVIAAIASSAMSCKAICSCCRPREENTGVVYYNNTGGNVAPNAQAQPIVLQQQPQPGYITIPISQIQAAAASVGATAIPNEASLPGATMASADSPPPKYESVAALKKEDEVNESKYQRFE